MRAFVPLAVAVLLLAACGKAEDAAVGVASGGAVQKDGDKTTISTEQGDVVLNAEEGQSLPSRFPKDVYLPEDYVVRSSMDMQGALMVDLVAPGSTKDAFAAAGKWMPEQNWTQTAMIQQGGQSVLVFEKERQLVQYSFFEDEADQVHVTVQLTEKGPD